MTAGSTSPRPSERSAAGRPKRGALLPTGNVVDVIEGVPCTLIDNGMPCIVFRAADVGATGTEAREQLESDALAAMRGKIEAIRLAAGERMNLGDVTEKSVPKMMLVAPPRHGGAAHGLVRARGRPGLTPSR